MWLSENSVEEVVKVSAGCLVQCLEVIVIFVRFTDGLSDLLGAQRREGESGERARAGAIFI